MTVTTSVILAAGTAFITILGLIFIFRRLIDASGKSLLENGTAASRSQFIKKHPEVDLSKYSWLLLLVGLSFSLSMTLFAFEMKGEGEGEVCVVPTTIMENEPIMIPTKQELPPPPKVKKNPEIKEVEDIKPEEEIVFEMDAESESESIVEDTSPIQIDVVEEKEEMTDLPIIIVEENAEFIGGAEAYLKYLRKNLKYPKQAQKMNVEGKVYVQFVVNKEGEIMDVKVLKGIGAGCDEEAMRVIKESPKWKPGKQRGRAVKQQMVVPIVFKLNS